MKYLENCFFILLMGTCFTVGAQTHSTKETKVVLIVSNKTGSVTDIAMFHVFQNMKKEEIFKKYNKSKFYVGLLSGRYEIENDNVVPKSGTTVIMYTEKQIFPDEDFSSANDLSPGDPFNLGKTRAKVVSSKKGELIVKT